MGADAGSTETTPAPGMWNRECCMCGHKWMGRDDDACPCCNDGARSKATEALRRITHGPWVDWTGGNCPIREYERPEVRYRSGGTTEMQANQLRWSHTDSWDDVLAYRVRLPERNNA